jgi:polysaccharide biosynthesis/export protein
VLRSRGWFFLRFCFAVCLSGLLAGCLGLPGAGPTSFDVERLPLLEDASGYYLVPITPGTLEAFSRPRDMGFSGSYRMKRRAPTLALHAGDVIGVTIFESSGPSIFTPYASPASSAEPIASGGSQQVGAPAPAAMPMQPKATTLPALTVEGDGTVEIPFAGPVHVGGLSPATAAHRIEAALGASAINPRVLVSVISNVGSVATVGGDANRPASFALTMRGERLLDLIGQAGGSKWQPFDTDVRVIRGTQMSTVKLQRIIDDASQNIVVVPNDQIFLLHSPTTFAVLGAAQKVSQYTFDVPQVSIADAVSRAGGPIDSIGNPGAIYLFREEPVSVMRELVATNEVLSAGGGVVTPQNFRPDGRAVDVLYKIDLNDPEGYFLARKAWLHDRDVILMANAEGAQLLKFLTIARGVTGGVGDIIRRN